MMAQAHVELLLTFLGATPQAQLPSKSQNRLQ